MRVVRALLSLALVGSVIGGAVSSSAHTKTSSGSARRGDGARPSDLTFSKPQHLRSASPVRTALSAGPDYGGDEEWSGEPVIQVDKKGTIFIAGTCCIRASSPVWYSTSGKRFQEAETPAHAREWSIGTEGDLAIDDNGHVYFVDTYVNGLVLTRWSLGETGPTWDYTVPANIGVPPGFNDRPWLAWSEKALYMYIHHMTHTAVYRSTDGGLTWMGGAPLSWEGATLSRAFWPGHIAADRKRGWVYASGRVDVGRTLASAASEDGVSFSTSVITKAPEDRAFSPLFNGATAVDEAGNVYVTWSMADQATTAKESRTCEVYYAFSTNKGKSWSDPVRVSRGPGCATFPWIAAGANGKVALTWYQTPTELPTHPPEMPTNLPLPTRYGVSLELSPQDEAPADTEWFVHVAAIVNATSKRPAVAEGRVPTQTPIALGPLGRQLWDFLQLAIGPKGDIHIAFAEKYKDDEPQTWYVNARGPKLR